MYNPVLGPFKILGAVAFMGILMGFGFSAMHKKNVTNQSGRVIEVKEEADTREPSRVVDVSFTDTGCTVVYNYGGSVSGKYIDNGELVSRCNYDGTEDKTQDELNCLAYSCLKK
jgi:hypothetical protein